MQSVPITTNVVIIPPRRGILDTTLCDKVCQWLATGRWFSPDLPVSSTNKTDRHGNLVESSVKHHQTNKTKHKFQFSIPGLNQGHVIFLIFILVPHPLNMATLLSKFLRRTSPSNVHWLRLWFFSKKKYSDSQCCWKKYSDCGGGKKK